MRCYEFEGTPVAWKRAGRCGARYYDPQFKEKELMRNVLKIVDKAIYCSNKKLAVYYEFNMPIPQSWRRIRRLNAIDSLCVQKGKNDIDNLVKFVNDTFNGILWEDDSQIAEIWASKRYAESPSTKIIIMEEKNE